jgi:hypothetical protein
MLQVRIFDMVKKDRLEMGLLCILGPPSWAFEFNAAPISLTAYD